MKLAFCFLLLFVTPTTALAEQVVLPVYAYGLEGRFDLLWFTEVYLTNASDSPANVQVQNLLEGHFEYPWWWCSPSQAPSNISVPPESTLRWHDLPLALGCPHGVGGLVFETDGEVQVFSRLLRVDPLNVPPLHKPYQGIGQRIAAVPVPAEGAVWFLPGMLRHRNACTGSLFDSYVGLANPTSEPLEVEIRFPSHSDETAAIVDGTPRHFPHSLDVPANGWMQFSVRPLDHDIDECLSTSVFDLLVQTNGPVVVYGSVVDRLTGDPRTVRALLQQ